MVKPAAFWTLIVLFSSASASAQGPCSAQSSKLACVLPQEYGTGVAFNHVLEPFGGHPVHYQSDFSTTLKPLTVDIGRQANLLPLASPSSGIILVYDSTLKNWLLEQTARRNALLQDGNQNDRVDARKLSDLLYMNKLKPVYHGDHGQPEQSAPV